MPPSLVNSQKPSLLIIGHPKGLTTRTWQACKKITGLRTTSHAIAGEILNADRCKEIHRFLHFDKSEECYDACKEILEQHLVGWLVKDVVQPYAVCRYIAEYPGAFRVLFIERDPVIVRWRQTCRGWGHLRDPAERVEMFRNASDAVLTFEDVTENPAAVWNALRNLGYDITEVNYIDAEFRRERQLQKEKLRDFNLRSSTMGIIDKKSNKKKE